MKPAENSPATATGRPFQRGQSGNPGGRPKGNAALRAKCRDMDDELLERLRAIAMVADTDAASVAAIKLLLAYGHGAPEAKPLDDDDDANSAGTEGLTREERLAMAREYLRSKTVAH